MNTNRDTSADELHLATIGGLLISELFKSRLLRKKIRGTNLETQLKKLLKNDTIKRTAEPTDEIQQN
jgi:hypothetical protein